MQPANAPDSGQRESFPAVQPEIAPPGGITTATLPYAGPGGFLIPKTDIPYLVEATKAVIETKIGQLETERDKLEAKEEDEGLTKKETERLVDVNAEIARLKEKLRGATQN
jgi:hypothetical protein